MTGGSRGIGRAISLSLAVAVANIALNYRQREEDAVQGCKAIRRSGRRCIAAQGNLAETREVSQIVETVDMI